MEKLSDRCHHYLASLDANHDSALVVQRISSGARAFLLCVTSLIVALSLAGFVLMQAGSFPRHLRARQHAYTVAETILTTTACTDPHKRAIIGSKQCRDAEMVLVTNVHLLALADTLNSFNFCRDGYCISFLSQFALPFTLMCAAILVLVIMVSIRSSPNAADGLLGGMATLTSSSSSSSSLSSPYAKKNV